LTDWTGPAEPIDRDLLPPAGHQVGQSGAKGTVRAVDGSAYYKEYREPVDDPTHLNDLITWRRSLPAADRDFLDAHCAWPLRRVQQAGRTTGFLMAPAPDEFWADMLGEYHTVELQHLIHTQAAARLGVIPPSRARRMRLVRDLADLLAFFDEHDIVYGDISEKNVLWTMRGTARTYLIDCDNARPAGTRNPHAAMAGNENWRDPLLGPDDLPDLDSDRFALAVFFYRVVYGATASVDQDNGEVLLPDDAPPLPTLERLLAAGVGPKRPRPTAAEWSEAIRGTRQTRPAPPVRRAPSAPISRRQAAAILAAPLIVGAVLAIPLIDRRSPAVPAAPPPAPSPAVFGRTEAASAWAAGPVKLQVDNFYSVYDWEPAEADREIAVYLRVSVTNETGAILDLSNAFTTVVLVMTTKPKRRLIDTPVHQVPGLADREPLFSLGSKNCCTVTYSDVLWTGEELAPGETFTSDDPAENGLAFKFAAMPTKNTKDFAIAPEKAQVLGVGWRDETGRMLGFTPVSAWTEPNKLEAFAQVEEPEGPR
jgi:hypothetical protein